MAARGAYEHVLSVGSRPTLLAEAHNNIAMILAAQDATLQGPHHERIVNRDCKLKFYFMLCRGAGAHAACRGAESCLGPGCIQHRQLARPLPPVRQMQHRTHIIQNQWCNRFADARERFEQLLARNRRYMGAHNNLGNLLKDHLRVCHGACA